ncbi:MAG: hypothetical protein C0511_07645 [Hyphomicrobium sp.]|nr:hypothetical protein [Erythrobacter sp.]MBA4172514.1 hypothetical protein [Hyphomicrobium sp.]
MTSRNNYKKKLIEVAIPLEAINAASAREKSIRHGHPSTLHLWWARRPLAACRAVLFAQLVDDPSSHPETFPTPDAVEQERKRLFGIIEDLVRWENSTNEELLEQAREEIRKSCGGKLPPIYDPFSGGGSIPLEAQRLGLPAYGSDLNPVAVMIGKAMIELPPQFADMPPTHPGPKSRQFYRKAEGLAEDVKFYGEWIRDRAWERIGHLYPQVNLPNEYGGGKATVIAWIWSRTVASPDPALRGIHVPLISSFVLSERPGNVAVVKPVIDPEALQYSLEISRDALSSADLTAAKNGTRSGKAEDFLCLFSKTTIQRSYIRDEGRAGRLSAKLLAAVVEAKGGRIYIPADRDMEETALSASQSDIPKRAREGFLSGKTPTRAMITGGVCSAYGLETWGDLFTDRQVVALSTFSDLVKEARAELISAGAREEYANAVSVYLAFAISKLTNLGSTATGWMGDRGAFRETFARQGIPMVWDFAEANFFSSSGGNLDTPVDKISSAIAAFPARGIGKVAQINAEDVIYPEGAVVSTDPPYYNNIVYSVLSDYFYAWLKLNLVAIYPDLFGSIATPKTEELVAVPQRHGGVDAAEQFFLSGMSRAMAAMENGSGPEIPTTIYYAFKQSEVAVEGVSSTGWAAFLSAVLAAGFVIKGTWPIRTESPGRLIAKGKNALANSVVLVCRKRDASADVITRAEFIRLLKRELPPAIGELQAANIAPADMPQSAIGPGMGVFSRYKAVLESDDSPMSVKTALQLINKELDEYLGGIQGEFDADTRFAVTWFEQHGTKAGDYGSANSIAQARGISVESVKHAGIVESSAGKVRILVRDELDSGWDPASDGHLTVWECCQHLIRALEAEGEHNAALLLKKIGPEKADAVKDLAYCLYGICEKRSEAKEATSYNALIAVWTELTRQAAAIHDTGGDRQTRLDL